MNKNDMMMTINTEIINILSYIYVMYLLHDLN